MECSAYPRLVVFIYELLRSFQGMYYLSALNTVFQAELSISGGKVCLMVFRSMESTGSSCGEGHSSQVSPSYLTYVLPSRWTLDWNVSSNLHDRFSQFDLEEKMSFTFLCDLEMCPI